MPASGDVGEELIKRQGWHRVKAMTPKFPYAVLGPVGKFTWPEAEPEPIPIFLSYS